VAVIDVAGFVADLKSQAIDHGFHVHDERHFVETYSLRQLWEVDLHPEEACSGPIDLHLSLDVDPRAMLGFEDVVMKLDDLDESPPAGFTFPLVFTWTLPPLPELNLRHLRRRPLRRHSLIRRSSRSTAPVVITIGQRQAVSPSKA